MADREARREGIGRRVVSSVVCLPLGDEQRLALHEARHPGTNEADHRHLPAALLAANWDNDGVHRGWHLDKGVVTADEVEDILGDGSGVIGGRDGGRTAGGIGDVSSREVGVLGR